MEKSSNQQQYQSKNKQQIEEDKVSTSEESAFTLSKKIEYSNEELIKKAEEYVDQLKLEKAVSLYENGLTRFPNDYLILDSYTDLLIQLGEEEKAKFLIEKSIQINPKRDGRKYFSLAEMVSGIEAVKLYKKGIEVLQNDISYYQQSKLIDEVQHCKKQQASAYSSIAQMYMTDLCDEKDAEQQCDKSLNKALQIDENNIDALQTLGNFNFIKTNDQEALKLLQKVGKLIIQNESEMPTIEFRIQTVRLLEELKDYKTSIKILDTIIKENDEVCEAWYHLGFCHYNEKKYQNSGECIKNTIQLIEKQKIKDQDIIVAANELQEKLREILQDEMQDESYETISQEDISEDEEMKE